MFEIFLLAFVAFLLMIPIYFLWFVVLAVAALFAPRLRGLLFSEEHGKTLVILLSLATVLLIFGVAFVSSHGAPSVSANTTDSSSASIQKTQPADAEVATSNPVEQHPQPQHDSPGTEPTEQQAPTPSGSDAADHPEPTKPSADPLQSAILATSSSYEACVQMVSEQMDPQIGKIEDLIQTTAAYSSEKDRQMFANMLVYWQASKGRTIAMCSERFGHTYIPGRDDLAPQP